MRNRRSGIWWILSLVWGAAVLYFAAQAGDESHSLSYELTRMLGGVFHPDFGTWQADVQADWIEGMEELVRKTAHYFEFAVLGILMFLAVYALLRAARRKKPVTAGKCAFIAFYVCAVIATLTELLQVYAVNRNAGATDVALDCFGIISGILFVLARVRKREQTEHAENRTVLTHRKG